MKKFIIITVLFIALLIGCQTYVSQNKPCTFNKTFFSGSNYTIYINGTNESYTKPLEEGTYIGGCVLPEDMNKFLVPVGQKYKGKDCCYPDNCKQAEYNPSNCECVYFVVCPSNSIADQRGTTNQNGI